MRSSVRVSLVSFNMVMFDKARRGRDISRCVGPCLMKARYPRSSSPTNPPWSKSRPTVLSLSKNLSSEKKVKLTIDLKFPNLTPRPKPTKRAHRLKSCNTPCTIPLPPIRTKIAPKGKSRTTTTPITIPWAFW